MLLPIIQELVDCGVADITVVVGHRSEQVKEACKRFVSNQVPIRFVEVSPEISSGAALIQALSHFAPGDDVLVNLGDTYVPRLKTLIEPGPLVLLADGIDDQSRWCTVEVDGQGKVRAFHNKTEVGHAEHLAVGVYRIASLPEQLALPLRLRDPEISDVLVACLPPGGQYQVVMVPQWFDVGHIDRYHFAKKRLLEARSFNSLEFDDFLGTVTKRSKHWEKLELEAAWVQTLPEGLQALAPRVIRLHRDRENTSVTMEYYGYTTAAELWLYSSFSSGTLGSMTRRLLEVLDRFRTHKRSVTRADFELIYRDKTVARVAEARRNSPLLDHLFALDEVEINGRVIPGWNTLWPALQDMVDALYDPRDCSLIHGDFCLSNILYDVGGGIVRVIDARGKWGNSDGGDIKYDVAKLRHSLCGLYDFIVNDLFECRVDGDSAIHYRLANNRHAEVGRQFDRIVGERFDLNQIKLIEGLLFISMLPLHANKPNRQLAMFVTGMQCLANVAQAHDTIPEH